MNQNTDKNTCRIIYLDYLRIISAFFIIIIHVAAQNKYVTDVNSYEWQVFNVYDGMSRWAVSVFIMISGALFLNKDVSIKDMYMKYVFKMLTEFLFWSLIYAIYSNGKDVGEIIYAVIHGHYHMWFILMITGLYICTPIIKLVKDNTRIMLYFMVLALIFSIIIPQIVSLVNDFGNNRLQILVNSLNDSIDIMGMKMVMGYTCYYLLGYYLNKIDLSREKRFVLYFCGIIGIFVTIYLDAILSIDKGVCVSDYSVPLSMNVLLTSSAVFVLFKQYFSNYDKMGFHLYKISEFCLGIYLVHPLVIDLLDKCIAINTLSFNAVVSVFIISIIVFVGSLLVAVILKTIPIIRKFIV